VKRLRWESPTEERSLPKHPYRDTALVYGGMSIVVVLVALLTGGDMGKAILIAVSFFVVATLWTWRNWRNRLRAQRARNRQELL
jgi:membrane protein implicated in regulation of membrane protease activity